MLQGGTTSSSVTPHELQRHHAMPRGAIAAGFAKTLQRNFADCQLPSRPGLQLSSLSEGHPMRARSQ